MKKLLSALTIMTMGSLLTIGSLLIINRTAENISNIEAEQVSSFTVEKIPEKKLVKKEPKPEPRPKRNKPNIPDMVNLDNSLSGIDFNIPGLEESITGSDDTLLGELENTTMTNDTVDIPPKVITQSPIEYPRMARQQGIEGYVILSILINNLGDIVKVEVMESSQKIFDKAALDGVKGWKFQPARYQGLPVKVWVRQKISFDLS